MLTIITPEGVIKNGLEKAGLLKDISPISGTSFKLSENSFKYTYDSVGRSLEIDKMDLGLLFENVDIDLTEVEYETRNIIPSLTGKSKLDGGLFTYETDIHSKVFKLFCTNFGIIGLEYSDVSMGSVGDVYTINVTDSIFYKGSVEVKYGKGAVE